MKNKGPKTHNETTGTKMFEFTRVRCMKRAARSAILPNALPMNQQFGVPKKRSGHRAVCNEENLWIWGGYCPVDEMSDDEWDLEDGSLDNSTNNEDGNTTRSPLYPQVTTPLSIKIPHNTDLIFLLLHIFVLKLWRFNFATKIWTLLKTTGDIPNRTVASHCGKYII